LDCCYYTGTIPVQNATFEKLQEKIAHMVELFAVLQRERTRLEQLASRNEHEAGELKKRLEHACQERTMLKQRLMKVMQHIDSLNVT
jgi:chromosome segregation ATPase